MGGETKFIEYLILAALLVPTARVIAGVVISLTMEPTMSVEPPMPAEPSIEVTSPAVYYADLEKQP
jgi:hypothetical protein